MAQPVSEAEYLEGKRISLYSQLNPEVPLPHTDRHQGVGREHELPQYESIRQVPSPNELRVDIISQPEFCEALERAVDSETGKTAKGRGKKEPWPIEPLPVIEVSIVGPTNKYMVSAMCAEPDKFVKATLLNPDGTLTDSDCLQGNRTASFFTARERAFFIVRDLKIKYPGDYKLRLEIYQLAWTADGENMYAVPINVAVTNVFTAYGKGEPLPPAQAMSPHIKFLQENGAKLKIRKTPTSRRRNSPTTNWASSMADATGPGAGAIIPGRGRGPTSNFAARQLEEMPVNYYDDSEPNSPRNYAGSGMQAMYHFDAQNQLGNPQGILPPPNHNDFQNGFAQNLANFHDVLPASSHHEFQNAYGHTAFGQYSNPTSMMSSVQPEQHFGFRQYSTSLASSSQHSVDPTLFDGTYHMADMSTAYSYQPHFFPRT